MRPNDHASDSNNAALKRSIVDAALELAEESSWESVRLHQIAERIGRPLADVGTVVSEKEDIVDAWFDRADQALLRLASDRGFTALDREHRLHRAMMTWFTALSAHRRPTRQMVFNKLEFGHLHYQIGGAMRVSRTVQWMREVAGMEDILPCRAVSEAGLTVIYLAVFARWMYDDSEGSDGTSRFLTRQLASARPLARLSGW